MTPDAKIASGFAHPVHDAARAFRAVLDAMARPGRIRPVPAPVPPAPLSPAAAAVVLTLCDGDAPLWLAPSLRSAAVEAFLRFHTGCAPAPTPDAAAFLLGRWGELRDLTGLRAGAAERPDLSATLIVEVTALASGAGPRLSGPGAPDGPRIDATGLDAAFWALLGRNGEGYPLGVDVILTCADSVAALPRTVRADG